MGSALYQIQNGKPKLIACASKRLPETARNYSITELELCGIAISIASFFPLTKKSRFWNGSRPFGPYIIKGKAEPATARIKRLLELISSYSFNLYYMKGKDMILSDFLSRQNHDDSNPHKIIPISFNIHNVLHEKYYNIGKTEKYVVQTQSQTKSTGIRLLEVHGMSKNLEPNIQPEKNQNIRPLKGNEVLQENPQIGQGRAGKGSRRPPLINQAITQTSELSKKIPEVSKNRNGNNKPSRFYNPCAINNQF